MTPNPSPAVTGLAAALAAVLAAVLALAGPHGARAAPERIVTIDTRPGVTIAFILVEPEVRPIGRVILFAGGSGRVRLRDRGLPTPGTNFLVRTRAVFARHGFLTAVIDVASDQVADGLYGWRGSREHRADVQVVADWLAARTNAPLWLIGTSRGTVSVAHLAPKMEIDGAVLTSSVVETSARVFTTVLDARLEDITAPVLIVHHRDDGCVVTPANNVHLIKERLTKSARTAVMKFTGGTSTDYNPCGPISHHGFLGIEDEVIAAIAGWIKARATP